MTMLGAAPSIAGASVAAVRQFAAADWSTVQADAQSAFADVSPWLTLASLIVALVALVVAVGAARSRRALAALRERVAMLETASRDVGVASTPTTPVSTSQAPSSEEPTVAPVAAPAVPRPSAAEARGNGELRALVRPRSGARESQAQRPAPDAGASGAATVTVARRQASLLSRQLEILNALERTEDDPEALARLFQLDNLTMQLRRHTESVLLFAGVEPGRRVREGMLLSDVVRTASSQVERYERVRIDLAHDPRVLGHHVMPIAHMLAELIENATRFAGSSDSVDVTGRTDAGGMTVEVVDHGPGIDKEAADAVRALLSAEAPGEALSGGRIGMLVVARISRRLGIDVTVSTGPDSTGTTVTLHLPSALFEVDDPTGAAAGSAEPHEESAGEGSRGTWENRPVPAHALPVPASDAVFAPTGAAFEPQASAPAAGLPRRTRATASPGETSSAAAPAPAPRPAAAAGPARFTVPGVTPPLAPATPAVTPPLAHAASGVTPPVEPAAAGAATPPVFPAQEAPKAVTPSFDEVIAASEPEAPVAAGEAARSIRQREHKASGSGGWLRSLRSRQPARVRENPPSTEGSATLFDPKPRDIALTDAGRTVAREEALAVLGELSGYRPRANQVHEGAPLVQRTPAAAPEQPVGDDPQPHITRDPNAVRDRFSSFQRSTASGRRARADAGERR